MSKHPDEFQSYALKKALWKIGEWRQITSLSDAYVRELIANKEIRSAKIGGARRIITDPYEFAAQREERKATKLKIKDAILELDIAI